jgi:hypothetical protein
VPAGSLTSTQLAAGAVSALNLQDGAVTGPKLAPNQVVRSLNGVRDDVSLAVGPGLSLATIGNELRLAAVRSCLDYTNCSWSLFGNGGTTPGVNFLGTIDNQALEMRVNNARALRLEPRADSPNIVGGWNGNSIAAGAQGAVIVGGGTLLHPLLL